MAIYSFNHDSFGLSTNRPGAAGDNVRYNADLSKTQMEKFLNANAGHLDEQGVHRSDADINAHLAELRQGRGAAENAAYNAREEACYAVRSHVIPPGPNEAEAWFREQEKGERKNARMSDRFIGALPRELTPEQCIEAVEKFCRDVTQDRVPWHFALHLELDQRDQANWNPHAHIIIRDRDIDTNRRVLYTSAAPQERARLAAKGIQTWSTRDFRVKWSSEMNRALERAGLDVRVDHRSLKDQGIDREPQIHIGPASQYAERKGYPFQSRDRQVADRTIPYSLLDQGTRAERNAAIVGEGRRRRPPGPHSSRHPDQEKLREAQAKVRKMMYGEQRLDRDALREAHQAELAEHRAWAKGLYADARKAAFDEVREQSAPKWEAIRAISDPAKRDEAAKALKLEQKKFYDQVSQRHVGQARLQKDKAWQALRKQQFQERADLRETHRQEYSALMRQHVAERLGTGERCRAQQLQRDGNRLAARFSGRQGMAAQQGAAQQAIRLSNRASRNNAAMNPKAISLELRKIVAAEYDKRGGIRGWLDAQRQTNRLRGRAPDRFRAQAGTAMQALQRAMDPDPQMQARQAELSGRTLSSDERANVPRDVRDRFDRQESKRATERFMSSSHAQHNRGRERGGGGRGR
jgi:MobA/MobL family